MATISASPRVAPLRWSPAAPARAPRPVTVVDVGFPALSTPEAAAGQIDWRIVRWLVAVFLGALVFSGVLAQLGPTLAGQTPGVSSRPAGPAESAAHPAYTVAVGDTLWDIASRTAPTSDPRETVDRIRELNGLSSGHVLDAGEVLMLPAAL